MSTPAVVPIGDHSLLVEFGHSDGTSAGAGDTGIRKQLLALARELESVRPEGVTDVVVAFTGVAVHFDPAVDATEDVWTARIAELRRRAMRDSSSALAPGKLVEISVAYGGEFGPDLDGVAAHTGLSREEVIRLHSSAEYVVGVIGFVPGFPYLVGLPDRLATPRLAAPRTRVPAGSVAIGGNQTGIYPLDVSGGWRIIGRTQIRLFDPSATPPALLQVGDRVRFVPEEQ